MTAACLLLMTGPSDDWRDDLLVGSVPLPGSTALRCAAVTLDGLPAVAAIWDFTVHGGSFGEADATAFVGAAQTAGDRRVPLLSLIRSGGTRLPEGMRALVGIPRAMLALQQLRAAGVPHISVADQPTTGGVWVAIGSAADIRVAVTGSIVGFSGPRVAAEMTGRPLADGANRAESAYDDGLVDVLAAPESAASAVLRIAAVLRADDRQPVTAPPADPPPGRDGWEQVADSRDADRPDGRDLLAQLLPDAVRLRGGDETVTAALGRVAGRRVVAVALAATRTTMPTPAGFRLLGRAARLAGDLDLGLVVFVDLPGADPHTERDGLAMAIGDAMLAVLHTAAPTIALVHGAGGSGGALAGAVTDVVGVGAHAWFAALAPEGAAAALRITPAEAAAVMRITPANLLDDGFADGYVGSGQAAAWIATQLDELRRQGAGTRMTHRLARWSAPLPGVR